MLSDKISKFNALMIQLRIIRKLNKIAVFCILLLSALNLRAQAHSVFGAVPTYYQYGQINKKFDYGIYAFSAHHIKDLNKDTSVHYPSQLWSTYVEFDLTYKINKRWLLTGSYTLESFLPFQDTGYLENRAWLQILYSLPIKKATLMNRFRYDFRFVNYHSTSDISFEPRLRYFIGGIIPFKKGSPYLFVYNESFFNTFITSPSILAANLAYASVGFALGKRFSIEPGLLVSSYRRDANGWTNQYYFQTTFYAHLNFPQKMKAGMLSETDYQKQNKRLKRGVQR